MTETGRGHMTEAHGSGKKGMRWLPFLLVLLLCAALLGCQVEVYRGLTEAQVNTMLSTLLKRGIEGTSLDVPEDIVHSGKTWFVEAKLKQGIESAVQKKIVKLIKDSKLKVQAQIQGEEIRVTGKSRDDLQSVMALVRGGDLGQPFQFKNFRD